MDISEEQLAKWLIPKAILPSLKNCQKSLPKSEDSAAVHKTVRIKKFSYCHANVEWFTECVR